MAMCFLHLLVELYPDPEARDQWLASPQPLLGGQAPDALISRGQHDQVRQLLQQIADGVHL